VKKNIHAYTEAGFSPAYISVNTEDDGKHVVTVRGSGAGAGTGEITMTGEQLAELAADVLIALTEKITVTDNDETML